MVLSLLIGALIGGAAVGTTIFIIEGREGTLDILRIAGELPLVDFITPIVLAFVAMVVAIVLHIVLHEAGHLLMGLATGSGVVVAQALHQEQPLGASARGSGTPRFGQEEKGRHTYHRRRVS